MKPERASIPSRQRRILAAGGWLAVVLWVSARASMLPDPVDGTVVRGLWWNPDSPGAGLDIHRAPGTLDYTVIWYHHDADGEPVWSLGSAPLKDGKLDLALLNYRWPGGDAAPTAEAAGRLTIEFENPSTAALTWEDGAETRGEPIRPFLFDRGVPGRTLSGLWADTSDPGWGFSIATQGEWTVVIHYYYDEAGTARWVIGQSDRPGQPFEMLKVRRTRSGLTQGTGVAQLHLDPIADEAALVQTDLPDWPVDGRVTRLTDPLFLDEGVEVATAGDAAFVGVNVLPMERNVVLRERVVMVSGGTVASLVGYRDAVLPQGTRLLRGEGRWLVPGLVDSHVHLVVGPNVENDLFTVLANGVTTVRQMWGQDGILALRDRIHSGAVLGPRILSATPGIEGPQSFWPGTTIITTPAQGRQAVRDAAGEGFDFIKVYTRLSLENYRAIVNEAAKFELPVVGHVSPAVGLSQALNGHHSIEHLLGYQSQVTASGIASWDADLADSRVRTIVDRTAQAGIWNCPTQVVVARSTADISRVRGSAAWRRLSPEYRAWLEDPRTQPGAGLSDRALANRLAVIRALWEAGALLAVGTDSGIRYVLPGPGIHEEIAFFRQAGIPPFDVLQMATWNGGRIMGRPDDIGRIAPGASADLLLLSNDPRQNLAALQSPDGVMVRGRWLSANAIATRLSEIEAAY